MYRPATNTQTLTNKEENKVEFQKPTPSVSNSISLHAQQRGYADKLIRDKFRTAVEKALKAR